MRLESVPIVYGTPVNAPLRYEAERTLFPNSHSTIRGGCVMGKKTHSDVFVCPACRAAEAEWRRQHPREW
jgi:hypothetical protein